MSDSFYTKKVSNSQWSSASLMLIGSVPAEISGDLVRKILTLRDIPGTSFELFISHGEKQKAAIDIELLIRARGSSPLAITGEISKLTENVRYLLSYEGAIISVRNAEQTEVFDRKLQNRTDVVLAFPGENARAITSQYVPGGYDDVKELDLQYLASIISEHPGAGMSIQINRTKLIPEERNGIIVNMERLGSLQTAEASRCLRIYDGYLQLLNVPAFCVCVTVWGDGASMNTTLSSLRDCRYSAVRIPQDTFFGRDYIAEGDALLQSFSLMHGHSVHPDMEIPYGCNRLNYMTDIPGVMKVLSRMRELSKFKSASAVVSASRIPDDIPEELLDGSGIRIGEIIGTDRSVALPEDFLVKHAIISGMPGSGKTSLIFYILNELYRKNIPFIAIEPVKSEYRELIGVIPELKVYTPGRTDISPFMFNPFLPPENITLEQFLPSLEEAFSTIFSMTTPLDVIFPEALRNCYAEHGWTGSSTSSSPDVEVFGMHEFIEAFKREALRSNYDQESKQNLLSGGVYRLQDLLNANPYLFDTDHSISFRDMMNGYTVIELDAIDNPEQKALIMCLMMMQFKLLIRHNQKKDSKIKNVILLDEAHVLLEGSDYSVKKNEADPVGRIREYLIGLVKISRAYGTGMIFSDQSLSIMRDLVNNADIKITMRLENAEEREFLARNLGYSPEVYNGINKLGLGQFVLSCGAMQSPLFGSAPDSRTLLSIPSDVDDKTVATSMQVVHNRPFAACPCRNACDVSVRNLGETIARRLIGRIDSEMLNNKGKLENYIMLNLNDALKPMVEGYDNENKLLRCAGMQFRRMIGQKTNF